MNTYKIAIKTIPTALDLALGAEIETTIYEVEATSRRAAEAFAKKAHRGGVK